MERKRYSRQRELIYNCLQSTKIHPTAETIYQTLKPEHPKLSLGTVYRNLNQLSEAGLIARMPFPVERFDADTSPHAHFCCEKCGQVFDVPLSLSSEDEGRALCGQIGALMHRETRLFYGVCKDCAGEGVGAAM